jgi:hypothetical protein
MMAKERSPRGMSSSVVICGLLSSSSWDDVDIFAARCRHDVVMSRWVVVIRIAAASPMPAVRRKDVGFLSQPDRRRKNELAPWKPDAIAAPVASDEHRQKRPFVDAGSGRPS